MTINYLLVVCRVKVKNLMVMVVVLITEDNDWDDENSKVLDTK